MSEGCVVEIVTTLYWSLLSVGHCLIEVKKD